jgi:hypothetical protein
MSTLQLLQQTLGTIEAEAAARERALEKREADIARALEDQTALAVKAAVADALTRQREWFVDLIDARLEQLGDQSTAAIVLRTLRGVVAQSHTTGDDQ